MSHYNVKLTVDGVEYTATLPSMSGAKLLSPSGEWKGDAFWIGRELVVANGAASDDPEHNNPIRRLSGHLYVEEQISAQVFVPKFDDLVDIDDGAGKYIPLRAVSKVRIDARDQVFIDWHNADGPDEPDFEGWWLDRVDSWGPKPDYKDPGNTGSSRMVRGRCSAVHKLLHEIAEGDLTPDEALMDDSQRWVGAQWERQVHYYDWSKTGLLPGLPAAWNCEEANVGRKARIGWGYRAPGGPSETYSGEVFYGRIDEDGKVWHDNTIPYPPDHAHFEIQKVLWIALFTKSHFALWHALACVEANHSRKQPNTQAWWGMARSYGWTLEGESMLGRVLDIYFPEAAERVWRYAEWTLQKLEDNNVFCAESGITMPMLDGGGVSAAIDGALELVPGNKLVYHCAYGLEQIKAHAAWKQEHPSEPETDSPHLVEWHIEKGGKEHRRGCKVFYLGILCSGLDKAMVFAPPALAARAKVQLDIAASLMVRALGPALSIESLQPEESLQRHFVYLLGLVEKHTSSPAGTDTSFVLPGVEVCIRRYGHQIGTQVLVDWVDKLVASMKASNYWGGSGHPDKGLQSVKHGPGWETARRGALPGT